MYQSLSARLRMDVRRVLGPTVLSAIQDHLYHKALNYFDAKAEWQTVELLALSEMAHRLRKFATELDAAYPARAEAQRLSMQIWDDYMTVFKNTMASLPVPASAALHEAA